MMTEARQLVERFNFSELPKDCRVVNVCVDWNGEPVVLCEEGKPPQPAPGSGMDATIAYLNAPPRAHHIIHWLNGCPSDVRFHNPGYTVTAHAQPFEGGWLLGEARGGIARIFDSSERLVQTFDLGDASEHVQTTPDGHIWVAYFDEGVFGNDIGNDGAICFDRDGKAVFKFNEYAVEHQLPTISDCYTLNVAADAVWLCYYSAFPLVCLTECAVSRIWPKFQSTRAVAVRGESFIRCPAYRDPFLRLRTFDADEEISLKLIAPDGRDLSELTPGIAGEGSEYVAFQACARGARLYVYNQQGLYELP